MTARDEAILQGTLPALVTAMDSVYAHMAAIGRPMRPTEGLRTIQRQQKLYAQGRTAPGPVVTLCDGIITRSNHQARDDGYGYAVDSCFLGPDPYLEHDPHADTIWQMFGAAVREAGLLWGGDWHGRMRADLPHAEWKG